MTDVSPFSPGNSLIVAVTATSAGRTLPAGSGTNLYVQNIGANDVWIAVGTAAVIAIAATAAGTSASMPLANGGKVMLTIDTSVTTLAAIAATAASLYVTRGQGRA